MRHYWLNRQANRDAILFMAGWGMAPEPFLNIPAGNVDVLMIYDYCQLETGSLMDLLTENREQNWHLLAWSMGVWVAAGIFADEADLFVSRTAVGGTCRPVDDRYGIPEQLFISTIKGFSPQVLRDFYASMFDSREQAELFLEQSPQRSLAEIKEELMQLYAVSKEEPAKTDIFQHHLVTSRDRIFPARNQIRAWGRQNCQTIALPHFPFYQWQGWEYLLEKSGLEKDDSSG